MHSTTKHNIVNFQIIQYGYKVGSEMVEAGKRIINRHERRRQEYPGHNGACGHRTTSNVKCTEGPGGRWEWVKRTENELLTVKGHWIPYEHEDDAWCENVFLIEASEYNKIYNRCKKLLYKRVVAGNLDQHAHSFLIRECYLLDFRGKLKFNEDGYILCPERFQSLDETYFF